MGTPDKIIEILGPTAVYLGETDGVLAFYAPLEEDAETGFPVAAEYKDGQVKVLYEFDAMALIGRYAQD